MPNAARLTLPQTAVVFVTRNRSLNHSDRSARASSTPSFQGITKTRDQTRANVERCHCCHADPDVRRQYARAAQASASEACGTRIDRGRPPLIGRKSAVRAILWLLCALALGACGAGQRGPFGYDDSAELDVRVSSSHLDGGVRISELTYASPKGGRVPALLFVPSGRGPFAGLIVQHGLPSSKEDVAFDAEDLAGLGAVVIAIDAPFARRRVERRLRSCDVTARSRSS